MRQKVAICESQLAGLESRADALRDETRQLTTRTEACESLVEQKQKDTVKALAELERAKASISNLNAPPLCLVPAPSPTDHIVRPARPKMAVVSFPGGPRTVTIHPPHSPQYQSIIRDEKGDVIITFKDLKPLRREGAFRGPLEEIDMHAITRVYGRGPEPEGPRAIPPIPRWPDRSRPLSSYSAPSPSDVIARQRQLSFSMQTDAFGRVLAPDYLIHAKSPSLPTGMPSSSEPSQDSQSSSSVKSEAVSTPTSPSASIGRGKKRTRLAEEDEDEGVPSTTETLKTAPPQIDPQTTNEPLTPTSIKRQESHSPEGPAKRKKLRSSTSGEALSAGSRSNSALDVTRTTD